MPKRKIIILIAISILIIAILALIYTLKTSKIRETSKANIPTIEQKPVEFSLILEEKGEKIKILAVSGDTLYQTLIKNLITLEGKEYPGLGYYVTKIGATSEMKAQGGKNLFYYINGEEANVGISSYVPKQGDIISWRLK